MKRPERNKEPLPYDEDFLKRYGIEKMTSEEVAEENRIIEYARSLGIMLDCFDGFYEPEGQKEADRSLALYYIDISQEIPKDLMERLLRYKAEDERKRELRKKQNKSR